MLKRITDPAPFGLRELPADGVIHGKNRVWLDSYTFVIVISKGHHCTVKGSGRELWLVLTTRGLLYMFPSMLK